MSSEVGDGVRALLARALCEGWNEPLEREVDDYALYLSTELERFEDMDPSHQPSPETGARLMEGLERLLEVLGEVRDSAVEARLAERASSLHASIDVAAALLGESSSPR